MIIGIIFLVVLLSTLWTVALVFHVTLILAIVPTVAVVLAVAAILVIKRLQARAAAQAIEKTLKSQGEAFAAQVRPDQQPEVQALQSEFAKAVGALKSSKLARGGSDALGVLLVPHHRTAGRGEEHGPQQIWPAVSLPRGRWSR